MGACGQSTMVSLFRSFLLTPFPCSSVGPSHTLQSLMKCSSVCPLHGLQSIRINLIQHGSSMGHSCCQENLLLHGLFCTGCSFLQEISTCSTVGSSTAGICSSMVLSTGCRRISCSGAWNTTSLPSSFFSDLGVCRAVSHTFPHIPHTARAAFYHLSTTFSPRCNQPGQGARLCPAAGPTWAAPAAARRDPCGPHGTQVSAFYKTSLTFEVHPLL